MVEVEGQRLLPTACSTPVSEGMVVQTASPKVLKARRNILELIFARHPQECLVCPKDGKCDLQKVAQDVGMHLDIRYDKQLRHQKEDWSSPAIMRNPQKCILCGRVWRSAMRFRNQRPFEGKPWIPYADRPAYGENWLIPTVLTAASACRCVRPAH